MTHPARVSQRHATLTNEAETTITKRDHSPSRVKSNSGGKSFPFGIFAPSIRNSSKKGCTIASTALNRASGVYSNTFDTRSIASGAVRGRNTCTRAGSDQIPAYSVPGALTFENGWALICGNLCFM